MQITEAGRATVQSEEFLQEFHDEYKAALEVYGYTPQLIYWMAMMAAFTLCGKPMDYEPSQDEFNGFMALHKAEVVQALEDCSARMLAKLGVAVNLKLVH